MADGNIGSLWLSLGIRDEMSKAIEKITKGMRGVDEATQKAKREGESLVKALEGINGNNFARVFREANAYIAKNSKEISGIAKILKNLGDSNAFTGTLLKAKGLEKTAAALRKANAELAVLAKTEGKEADVSQWRTKISNALDYIKLLQDIIGQEKKLDNTKALNPNVDTKSLDNAKKSLEGFRAEMTRLLQSGGVDDSNVLGSFKKLLDVAKKDVQDIVATFKKDNPLSLFSGGAAKVETDLARVTEKLARLRDLMAEGTRKGFMTGMLGGSIMELDKIMARLNAAKLNPTMLTDASQMRNLISDVLVEMTKATVAESAYRRERGKTVEVERAVNQEISNEHKAAQQERERDLQALSNYTKRYMELQEAKRKADKKASDERKRQSDAEKRRIEADTARMSKLYATMSLAIGRGERAGMRGLELGVNTSALEKALSDATELKKRIEDANIALMGKGGRPSYSSYAEQVNKLTSSLTNATQAQKDLNSAQDKANRKAEAQATRDAAKAKREDIAAEKQRQREISATERRYDSLGNKIRALRGEFSRGISLGANTDKSYEEIHRLFRVMRALRYLQGSLSSTDWREYLGRLGNFGSGHDTTLAGRVLQDQRAINAAQEKTNREKEKSIELERAHQQEVARTAAKVRGDLAKAFEQAKNHSLGMNSTLQDLKSLFMQGGLVYGAQQFAMSIIQAGGEIEKQHIALQSIIGDVQNANVLFNQTKELALNSPFTFSELNKDVKQLAAYGVEYDELYDTTKRLADMASGLGVSFERIALAFGQVRSRGWLDGKELRQISYAGIPILQKLSEYYTKKEGQKVSTSEVKSRISNRGVDFEDVKNVFWEMTDAGGQFYNMQQVLSETLLGRYNKLKDAWEIMLSEFASGNNLVGSFFKTALDGATALVQALHTLALPVGAVVAGYAMRRALMGNTASSLLSTKGGLAKSAMEKQLRGENLTQIERNILSTKNKITGADLRSLMMSKQLNQSELARLRIAGKITQQQYLTYSALLKQQTGMNTFGMRARRLLVQLRMMMAGMMANPMGAMRNMWGSFTTSALASFRVIGMGAKALGASLWSAIGGLPGLIISGVTFGISYLISKSQELKQDMQQTMDEMKDRIKQIDDFMRDNNVGKIVRGDNEKEIDNAIESYKDKIREIAPESANAFEMKASEIESHKERLKYLEEQLKLLKEANKVAQEKSENTDLYEDLRDKTESAVKAAETLVKRSSIFGKGGVDEAEMGLYEDAEKEFDKFIGQLAARYKKEFPNIVNSTQEQQAMQTMLKNFLALKGASEEATMQIRSALNRALGLEDKDMEQAFASKLMNMVDSAFPEIADRIRGHKELDAESKRKVENLMRGAVSELSIAYPKWETELQRLLANSSFEAKIQLVYDTGMIDNFDPFTGRIYNNVLGSNITQWKENGEKFQVLKPLLRGVNDMYTARNNVDAELDKLVDMLTAEDNAKKNDRGDEATRLALKKKYEDLKEAAYLGLGYVYVPKYKKSNKVPKGKGNNEDKELKAWEERLNAFKSARQMYQKYKGLPNWGAKKADDMVRGLFPEVGDLSFDKYLESLEKLEKVLKPTTPERKKAITSLHRERSQWKYSEMLKPEADRLAADFAEILERGIRQADLHKALMEKTGDEDFASLAFRDGMMWDDQTRGMAQMFEEMTGRKIDGLLDATGATAKKALEDNTDAYNLWKKITDLVRNNYTGYLEKAADAIKETATWEEKLLAVEAKYSERIKQADRRGDTSTAERFRQMRDKEKGQVMDAQFKQSQDYLNFFGAITEMGEMKAREVAAEIRQHLNTALRDGSIDAREYAKQIQQIDEQLRKLSERRKGFFNGGIVGIAERKTEEGNAKISMGATSVAAGEEKIREGRIKGDIALVAEGLKLKMTGEDLIRTGKKLVGEGMTLKKRFENIGSALGEIANIANGISDAFNQVKDMSDALGIDTESDGWQDAQAAMSSLASITGGISKTFNAVKSGDIGGAVSGVASIITGPITAFAKAHDAKKERQIKLAERELKALENMQTTIKNAIEDSLGGIYNYRMDAKTTAKMNKIVSSYENGEKGNIMRIAGINPSAYSKETYEAAQKSLADPTNAYQAELTGLMAQRDQLQRQRANEDAKKKTDKDKLADYDQQIEEMERSIKNAAKNFLKEMYGVDMKSWASQLTDAVVSAWEKGEDAIDAYKKKAKEMVKDLTKNIISQKIMEQALQKPLDFLTQQIEEKGRLDEYDVTQLASDLYSAGEDSAANITAVLEELKRRGWDFSEGGSSSATNTIKGVTEETADLLAAYLNAIRLDVSVNRENIKAIATNVSLLPAMSEIQKNQLAAMNQLVTLAQVRNDRIDEIVTWTRKVSNGSSKIYVK
nr:MAG TPA: MAEBL protein [Caudoviricetes sp.]